MNTFEKKEKVVKLASHGIHKIDEGRADRGNFVDIINVILEPPVKADGLDEALGLFEDAIDNIGMLLHEFADDDDLSLALSLTHRVSEVANASMARIVKKLCGCGGAGETIEACQECYAECVGDDGETECDFCDGDGYVYVPCHECSESEPKRPETIPCPECEGNPCDMCHGDGDIDGETCPECEGNPCDGCDGLGYIYDL